MLVNKLHGLILFIHLFVAANSFAQPMLYGVTGNVVDKSNGVAIEGVRILILDLQNDSIVNRTRTGSEGHFEIAFERGNYKMSFIAEQYETMTVPIEKYTNFKNRLLTVGIELEPLKTIELDEVSVTAKDYRVVNERGKQIYYIGNGLKDIAVSMSNLLSYIPAVFVDIDGKVQLRGREPVVQINGRKSNLSKSEALRMLPSDMVKRIEIIRSPSASEDETQPIINIITDRRGRGVLGGVNLGAGAPSALNGGLHLAANNEKLNGYGLYGVKRQIDIKSNTDEFLENTRGGGRSVETENSDNLTNETNHFAEMQYEYLPNEKSELAGNVSIYADDNKVTYSGTRMLENNSTLLDRINQASTNTANTFSVSQTMEYKLKLNGGKDRFKAEFEYEYEKRTKGENFSENSNGQSHNINSDDKYNGYEMDLKFRYYKRLKNRAYLTVGYRLGRDQVAQNQRFETYGPKPISLENDIRYTQYNLTGSFSYSNAFNGLYYNLGFWLKNTNRTLENSETEEQSKQNFFNILPTIILMYRYGENNEIALNYYSFASQPRLSYLNSFNTSVDLQHIKIGNPNLSPQLLHRFELEYFKEFKNSALTATAYTDLTNGTILNVTTFDAANNIAISMPENIGKGKTYGVDFSYNFNALRWLNTIVKLNGKYGRLSSDEIGINEFYSLNTSFVNIIRLNSYKFELSWFYDSPNQTSIQTREASNQYFKLGLSRGIFKGMGNLVLSVNDPFNSGRRIQEISDANYYYRNEFNPNNRRIFLSLFMRFSIKSKFRNTEREIKEKGILK